MDIDKTGGPAFPHEFKYGDAIGCADGMTLRDYFAAKAMQSAILMVKSQRDAEMIAKAAYSTADAMLKERDA